MFTLHLQTLGLHFALKGRAFLQHLLVQMLSGVKHITLGFLLGRGHSGLSVLPGRSHGRSGFHGHLLALLASIVDSVASLVGKVSEGYVSLSSKFHRFPFHLEGIIRGHLNSVLGLLN